MSTTTSAVTPGSRGDRLTWLLADGLQMTKRNLLHYLRVPQLIFFSTVQPIMFVLLWRYVFGGAINVTGLDYVDFLLPGVFVQTVVFGAMGTGIGLAEDLHKGAIDRFRSLPMARSAVLAGRTAADTVRNVFTVTLMAIVGFLVGFRVHTDALHYFGGVLLLLVFAYSLMWGFAIVGLTAANAETAQLMSFPILFPLTFASSAFVPVETMPGWLQVFARNQPVTIVVDAVRALMLGGPTAEKVTLALLWSAGIVAVLAPLASRRYRRTD